MDFRLTHKFPINFAYLQFWINKRPKFGQFYTIAEVRWSVQHWLNKSSCVVSIFIHWNRIVSGWNSLANTRAASINKRRLLWWLPGSLASAFQSRTFTFRWMKIDKMVFIQTNRSFDLSGPIKLAKFRVFIYSKMEHKINKIRRNLCTSGNSGSHN